jgi:hypothetical protein
VLRHIPRNAAISQLLTQAARRVSCAKQFRPCELARVSGIVNEPGRAEAFNCATDKLRVFSLSNEATREITSGSRLRRKHGKRAIVRAECRLFLLNRLMPSDYRSANGEPEALDCIDCERGEVRVVHDNRESPWCSR